VARVEETFSAYWMGEKAGRRGRSAVQREETRQGKEKSTGSEVDEEASMEERETIRKEGKPRHTTRPRRSSVIIKLACTQICRVKRIRGARALIFSGRNGGISSGVRARRQGTAIVKSALVSV
jgi:hypothetical protein